jgi:hypothetical protein
MLTHGHPATIVAMDPLRDRQGWLAPSVVIGPVTREHIEN